MFSTDKKSALDAISHAQFIAFAPYVFQASVLLRDKGILKHLEAARRNGDVLENIVANLGLDHYQVRVLLEAGLGIARLPGFIVGAGITAGRVVEIMPDWAPAPIGLHLLTPPSALRPARVEALIAFLSERLRD